MILSIAAVVVIFVIWDAKQLSEGVRTITGEPSERALIFGPMAIFEPIAVRYAESIALIVAIIVFYVQSRIDKKTRLSEETSSKARALGGILREVKTIRDVISQELRRTQNSESESKNPKNVNGKEIEIPAKTTFFISRYFGTGAYEIILNSGLITFLELETQTSLIKLYQRIEIHNAYFRRYEEFYILRRQINDGGLGLDDGNAITPLMIYLSDLDFNSTVESIQSLSNIVYDSLLHKDWNRLYNVDPQAAIRIVGSLTER
jgi:hypothetical protein